jgi:leader peptidase (prepilin peptidase)/N-methyltransferase
MILVVLSFVLGAACGSLLSRCIYRLPRKIPIFEPLLLTCCPNCEKAIPSVSHTFDWLRRGGRCSECGESIGSRYPLVEAITGAFFAFAWWKFDFPIVIPIWVFGSLLIITTFIDFEFFFIPDVLSKPGIVAGIGFSLVFPRLQDTSSPLAAVGLSIFGAVLGGGSLFLIGEFGKLAFGRYKVLPSAPIPFSLEKISPEETRLLLDEEPFDWNEHFFRKTDRVRIRADEATINGQMFTTVDLIFFYDRLEMAGLRIPLANLHSVNGRTAYAEFPREAMGLGDVKLIAAIGAFTGWAGALFSIPVAAVLASVIGIGTILISRQRSSNIPFGPYLASAALFWVFWGKEFIAWYQHVFFRY